MVPLSLSVEFVTAPASSQSGSITCVDIMHEFIALATIKQPNALVPAPGGQKRAVWTVRDARDRGRVTRRHNYVR